MDMTARLTMVLGLALASCSGAEPASNQANSAAAPTPAAAPAPAPAKVAGAGCADALEARLDEDSFAGTGINASASDMAHWKAQGSDAFKAAAAALCRSRKLDPAELAAKRVLLIQYGGGADSAAVYEPEENGRETVILQYAYYPGHPGPAADDVSQAIECWSDPELEMCAEREP